MLTEADKIEDSEGNVVQMLICLSEGKGVVIIDVVKIIRDADRLKPESEPIKTIFFPEIDSSDDIPMEFTVAAAILEHEYGMTLLFADFLVELLQQNKREMTR